MIAQRLAGERLHLQHGPIDVVLRVWGTPAEVAAAERAAALRFRTILDELVAELPVLRSAVTGGTRLTGEVARQMLAACLPFARRGVFVTAMAAVAGAVADELLAAMRAAAPGLRKAFVNDGGDIAVFAAPGETLAIGLAAEPIPGTAFDGALRIAHGDGIGGIATSGRGGRSFSLGIADAVTVLARDAATADAAATLIANAANLDSPAVTRRPARTLDPDSDLGERLVTVAVGALAPDEIAAALDAGAERAEVWRREGLILGAALRLRGQARIVGTPLNALEAA
ncbi:UPF0280 family protein [Falsiroseomonas oryziterrae]|uniref:UPF0280 family protein n=1 Tax=Falsiroseomonas oryziterrae TaxID=2911368 RepID=UPI001F391895|nr:UPF0280 family protein [Roseomonas sp. NPKOSM-4]